MKLKKAKHNRNIWWTLGIHFLFPEFSKFPIIDIYYIVIQGQKKIH